MLINEVFSGNGSVMLGLAKEGETSFYDSKPHQFTLHTIGNGKEHISKK